MVDGLKALAKEHAELESQQTENIVKQASLQTQLDALNSAKEKYLSDLAKIEKEEKVNNAEDAVRSRQVLIWSQLDNHSLVSVSDIKLSNESEIRHEAEEKTVREFKLERDKVEAEYRARVRYYQGEGYIHIPSSSVFVGVETPAVALFSEKDLNSDNSRLERLRQEELSKIGESTYQRFARFIPVVGSAMDYSYDRISGTEFVGSLGIDAASTLALGGMQKAVAGSKAALQAQFNRNLYARFNQAPYNPRAMETMLKARYPEAEVISSTMPRANAKNVKLAGKGKTITIGTDKLTEEPIIKHFPFNERGMPIFDDVAKAEVRITGDLSHMTSEAHRKAATMQLKADIEAGKIDRKLFSAAELDDIDRCKPKIGDNTWHHHEDVGRMQLIPEDVNGDIGHSGGDKLWGMKKKK